MATLLLVLVVLVGILFLVAAFGTIHYFGLCWGGYCMGGFDMMGKGLACLVEAAAAIISAVNGDG